MGRAILPAAALLLAACVVDIEGAPCTTPGATAECPPGQACGNDETCSERAAACAATRCTPGASQCLDGDARVERCDGADKECGTLVVEDCTAQGLRCATRGATSACECPANGGSEFAAGAGGTTDASLPPFPTGLASPEVCRFGRLGDALAAAAAYGASGLATVQVHARAGTPVVFGPGSIPESFPLQVAAGVTLRGSTTPAGETVVRAEAGTPATILSVQGAVEDVRVENVSMTGTGIATSCGASGLPALLRVTLSGGNALVRGVTVQGACGASISGVDVSGVTGPALFVDAAAGAPVSVRGSRFHSSGIGVELRGGAASLAPEATVPTEVLSNALQGLLVSGTTRVDVVLDKVVVRANGGTGVYLRNVPATSTLVLSGCEISSNGATAATIYGGASQRTAGGVLLSQTSPPGHSILGNRIFANTGDQLAFESSGAWSINAGACGAQSNAFGCVGSGVAVAKVGAGSVDAGYTVWPGIPPDGFYFGSVTNTALYCPDPPGPPPPACP